jgi:hypothetical protein
MNDAGHSVGTKDQHLSLEIDLPDGSVLEELTLKSGDHNRWVTRPNDRYWRRARTQSSSAGRFP